MLYENRLRAESFGADAGLYDRIRPSYPAPLVDELLSGAVASVLDVGCGTGIVGRLFQDRGCEVLGVEPDARMARFARQRGLAVEVATFEDWQADGRRFELLVCGQAWHWIDPAVSARKAATLLRAHGRLGVFWSFGQFPEGVREALSAVYTRLEPGLERYSILLGNADRRLERTAAALRRTGCFEAPLKHTWSWKRPYTTAHWREQLLTHSDHRTLPPDRREALIAAVSDVIDGVGGSFEMAYETRLVSARLR